MAVVLDRMLGALEVAHELCGDLQRDHANNPLMLQFHRHLWIVRHSLNAARAASLDVLEEARLLREKGVEL